MKTTSFPTLLRLVTLCIFAYAAPNPAHAAQTIDAEIVDAGDYYLGLDGQPIRFKRKKDVFLNLDSIKTARQHKKLRTKQSGQNQASSALHNVAPDRPGFARINNHRWGGLEIIKSNWLASGLSANRQLSASSTTTPLRLAPVFAGENGRGEYLILPDIMISFSSKQAVLQHQRAMLHQFGMHVKNKMMFSDTNFVLAFDEPLKDFGQVFSATRDLMALPYIEWAEPNMQVKLKKTAVPNDAYFNEQWGLYSWGNNGAFCDEDTAIAADIDANDAWDLMKAIEDTSGLGPKPVIAIIDDGVNYNHPDLQANIWNNPNPNDPNFGGGTNICLGDTHGCNFGDFYIYGGGTGRTYNRTGQDNFYQDIPPLPQTGDTHGTQAAGIAAATRNNTIGITGSAYDAKILPVRLDFHSGSMDCVSLTDAFSYAAKYADIISNSWNLDSIEQTACQVSINAKLNNIASGTNPNYKRGASGNGTPVLFAAGNNSAGWQNFSIQVSSPGTLRFTLHKDWIDGATPGENAIWLDDITLPGKPVEPISSNSTMPDNWAISNIGANVNSGDSSVYSGCTSTLSGELPVTATGNHTIDGSGYSIKLETTDNSCKYLAIQNVNSGKLEFWVWASVETFDTLSLVETDIFRVYLDPDGSDPEHEIGNDLITRNDSERRGINNEISLFHNELSYPASHSKVIAVGASNDGSDSNDLFDTEDRAYFSQYGDGIANAENEISVVAPGISIRSTTSSGNYGYLSGASASTPMVAGIIANMLAVDPALSLADIKTYLQNGADEIGPKQGEFSYNVEGFNKYYGHGRANSYKSTFLAASAAGHDVSGFPVPPLAPPETCEDPNPDAADDSFWLLMMPAILAGAKKNKN